MTLPFEPAASPAQPASNPKRLITFDWDGTLCLKGGQPNVPLYNFAQAAKIKGYDVVIATNNKDFSMLQMILEIHAMKVKTPAVMNYEIVSKSGLRDYVARNDYSSVMISFDNEPETIRNYSDALFSGEVREDGSLEEGDLNEFAVALGIKNELDTILTKKTAGGPPGPFDSMNVK